MKYIITESKLNSAITEFLNNLFPVDNIHSTILKNMTMKQDGILKTEKTRVLFYIGDYGDDNNCFYWYDCGYFDSDGPARNICPTVSVEYEFENILTGLFGNRWYEPFKKWFTENFDLPVKTVDV
jgi:hypothetical protein